MNPAIFLRATALLVSLALAGCATPNLQPFADETVRLAEAVALEQRRVSEKFDQVIAMSDEACSLAKRLAAREGPNAGARFTLACKQKPRRENDKKAFEESRRVVDALLARAADYAVALAELARAGESGPEAARALVGAVRQIGTVAGLAGTVVSDTVAKALEAISRSVTRVQAQQSLAEATAEAAEAVAATADGIEQIYRFTHQNLVIALSSDEIDLLVTLTGEDLIGLFQDAALGREQVSTRLRARAAALSDMRGCSAGPRQGEPELCRLVREELRNAAEIGRLLNDLRPDYEAYVAKRTAAQRWRTERFEKAGALAQAVTAWKAEHRRVADTLKRCGGWSWYRCADLSAAALKTYVERIRRIRSELEDRQ